MAYPAPQESAAKIRKKVYANIVATISFGTKSAGDTQRLTDNFLQRRGIKLIKRVPDGKKMTLVVEYEVHGGWRSDFVKKIESDSVDMGIPLIDLDINTVRQEIPHKCPRQECYPCAWARGERENLPEPGIAVILRKPKEPDTVETKPEAQSLWTRLRGGKR